VYMITNRVHIYKLHFSVHEYGSEVKFSSKMKDRPKQSIAQRGIFLQLTAKLSYDSINKLY